jgi:hypothetical protein
MLTVVEKDGDPYLWVVGGRGGDNSVNGGDEVHFILAFATILSHTVPHVFRKTAYFTA